MEDKMTVSLNLHGVTKVKRNGGPKIYKESTFWNHVRNVLRKQGYDVIETNAEREGLMWADKYTHMVTMRNRSWALFHNSYAIRNVYEQYNRDGEIDLSIVHAGDEGEIHYGDNPVSNPAHPWERGASFPFQPTVMFNPGGFGASIYVFRLITPRAKAWVKENVQLESWQWMGDSSFAVDHRFVEDLAMGMKNAGMTGRDVSVEPGY